MLNNNDEVKRPLCFDRGQKVIACGIVSLVIAGLVGFTSLLLCGLNVICGSEQKDLNIPSDNTAPVTQYGNISDAAEDEYHP